MNKPSKTALILGASGLVGSELVKTLVHQNRYSKICLIVRSHIQKIDPIVEVHVVDFEKLEDYSDLFEVTDVFCCLGTTIKKAKSKPAFRKVDYDYPVQAAKLAKENGAKNFLIITAMGADTKSLFFYNQVKGDVEITLKALGLPALHIFRPSLLLGERAETRPGEQWAASVSGILNKLMVGPLRRYRAIEAKKVAAAMAAEASAEKSGVHIYSSDQIEDIANQK